MERQRWAVDSVTANDIRQRFPKQRQKSHHEPWAACYGRDGGSGGAVYGRVYFGTVKSVFAQ